MTLVELTSFNVEPSPGLVAWLAAGRRSLAFTVGTRLMLAGVAPDGRLAVTEHRFDVPAGLALDSPRTLHVATRWQLVRLEDALGDGELDGAGHDRLYLPQVARTTGFIGCLDVVIGPGGEPLLASAHYNCVAALSDRLHFEAIWRPPFAPIAAGDRCHLTGVAVRDGAPAFVACGAMTGEVDGWHAATRDGGAILDWASGEVVAAGLSLPHSPRWHDGTLYVAEGGTGALLAIDPQTGGREVVTRVPGFARGLAFAGGHAVVGCSSAVEGPHADTLAGDLAPERRAHGVHVVDLATGGGERLGLVASTGEVVAVHIVPETDYSFAAEQMGGMRERISLAR